MPRAKRVLAEADANVGAPAPKRNAKGMKAAAVKSDSKAKAADPKSDSKAKAADPKSDSKAAAVKSDSKAKAADPKSDLKATASESNPKAKAAASRSNPKAVDAGKPKSKDTSVKLKYSDPSNIEVSNIKYLTFCWPDQADEDEDEDDSEDGGSEDDGSKDGEKHKEKNEKKKKDVEKDATEKPEKLDARCGTETCKCNKPREQNPNWPIFLTEEGAKIMLELMMENEKRDQDNFGIYIYNDWSGYGTAEVMENALVKFNKIIFDKKATPVQKWAVVEGLGMFLHTDMMHFCMNENGPGNAEIVGMFGTMLLTAFGMVEKAKLFSKDSPIQNIGFIATLYLDFILDTWVDDLAGERNWIVPVVGSLDRAGIEIPSLDIMKSVSREKLFEIRGEAESIEAAGWYKEAAAIKAWNLEHDFGRFERLWHRWDWKKEWTVFYKEKEHKGGKHYDLSKMSAAEKRRYQFGGGW